MKQMVTGKGGNRKCLGGASARFAMRLIKGILLSWLLPLGRKKNLIVIEDRKGLQKQGPESL